jgi:hypothetical protein
MGEKWGLKTLVTPLHSFEPREDVLEKTDHFFLQSELVK